jgi:hypothetical protein
MGDDYRAVFLRTLADVGMRPWEELLAVTGKTLMRHKIILSTMRDTHFSREVPLPPPLARPKAPVMRNGDLWGRSSIHVLLANTARRRLAESTFL